MCFIEVKKYSTLNNNLEYLDLNFSFNQLQFSFDEGIGAFKGK